MMPFWIFWALVGGLIGIAAGQKKGWNLASSFIGGALLGPLAVLMFAMTGLVSKGDAGKKCPFCANMVKAEAIVCQHCHRDLPEADAHRQEREAQRRKEAYLSEIRSKRPERPS